MSWHRFSSNWLRTTKSLFYLGHCLMNTVSYPFSETVNSQQPRLPVTKAFVQLFCILCQQIKTSLRENLFSKCFSLKSYLHIYVFIPVCGSCIFLFSQFSPKPILVSHLLGKLLISASIAQLEFSAQMHHSLLLKQVMSVSPTKLPELTSQHTQTLQVRLHILQIPMHGVFMNRSFQEPPLEENTTTISW